MTSDNLSDGGAEERRLRYYATWNEVAGPRTEVRLCKHDRSDCIRCGTSARRDVRHSTTYGRGCVGRIPK